MLKNIYSYFVLDYKVMTWIILLKYYIRIFYRANAKSRLKLDAISTEVETNNHSSYSSTDANAYDHLHDSDHPDDIEFPDEKSKK